MTDVHKHTNSEARSEQQKGPEGDKATAGKPILSKDDNSIQQNMAAREALKAFRFTKDKHNSFSINMSDGTMVSDNRPFSTPPSAEVPTTHEKAKAKEAETQPETRQIASKPDHAGDSHSQARGPENGHRNKNPLHDVLVTVDEMLQSKKVDESLVGPKWTVVDMKNDSFPPNQILQDTPVTSYNCKYYLKTYIEGRKPDVKSSIDCELEPGYLQKHGLEKTNASAGDLRPGDVVVVKGREGHLAGVEHVAIVTRDKQGNLVLMQKPDSMRRVQDCTLGQFEQAYGKIDSSLIEVYRR